MSNVTLAPSGSPLKPDLSTAVIWTNTSLPPSSGPMKPNPLSVLKNFTVPLGTADLLKKERIRPAIGVPGKVRNSAGKLFAIAKAVVRGPFGLCQCSSFWRKEMKHQHHFGSATDVALSDMARISALINDLDRHVRILDCDIAAEEERARVFNPFDAAYPILARTLAASKDLQLMSRPVGNQGTISACAHK
jgi:hypothetical protein